MTYSIRFLTSFCVIASPILVYSYFRKNNIIKFIITIFALFGLILISTHMWRAPFWRIIRHMKEGYSITQIREIAVYSTFQKKPPYKYDNNNKRSEYLLNSIITAIPKSSKILYFPNHSEDLLYVKMLTLKGYNIDFRLLGELKDTNIKQYDTILITNMQQLSTKFNNNVNTSRYSPSKNINCVYLDIYDNEYIPNRQSSPHLSLCKASTDYFTNNNFSKFHNYVIVYDSTIKAYTKWQK